MQYDEADFTDQFVPTYVNQEPVVLFGLTDLELMSCIGIPFGLSLIASILIGVLWLGIVAVLVFVGLWLLGSFLSIKSLRAFKKGRPKGYMGAVIRRSFARLVGNKNLYLVDEHLCVGRSRTFVVVVKD